jgi:diketogulonate reductase-like aldo/keto reductase
MDKDIAPVSQENFFSRDFDAVQPGDVMKRLNATTSQIELHPNLNQLEEEKPAVVEVMEDKGLQLFKRQKLSHYQEIKEPEVNVNTMLI